LLKKLNTVGHPSYKSTTKFAILQPWSDWIHHWTSLGRRPRHGMRPYSLRVEAPPITQQRSATLTYPSPDTTHNYKRQLSPMSLEDGVARRSVELKPHHHLSRRPKPNFHLKTTTKEKLHGGTPKGRTVTACVVVTSADKPGNPLTENLPLDHPCRGPVPTVPQAAGYDPTNLDTTQFPLATNDWGT
jgi:hypothetical protein